MAKDGDHRLPGELGPFEATGQGSAGTVMGRVLRRVWRAVWRYRPPAEPVDVFAARTDVAEYGSEFDQVKLNPALFGRIDGGRQYPKPEDTEDPPFVAQVIRAAQEYGHKIVTAAEKVREQIYAALNEAGPDLKDAVESRARQTIDVDLPNMENVFSQAAVDALMVKEVAVAGLNQFVDASERLEHEVPNEQTSMVRFAVLATFALLVEGLVNGIILRDATDDGLRSAAIYGLIPSILNLATGLGFGMSCRYRFVRELPIRIAGWICTLLAVATCLLMAGAFGAWRARAQVEDISQMKGFLTDFWAHPMAWADDVMSIAMAAFGILTFAVAFVHGQQFTGHRYPGFARRWRNVRDKTDELNDLLDDFTEGTQELIDAAGRFVLAQAAEGHRHLKAYRATSAKLLRLDRSVKEALSLLILKMNELRRRYSTHNMRIRGAAPMPPRLMRTMTMGFGWSGCPTPEGDPIGKWHEERVRETEDAVLVAQTAMLKARTALIDRMRERLERAPGVAPDDHPAPPLANLGDGAPLIFGPIKGRKRP